MNEDQIAANRRVEALWREGKISWEAFDWWLRTMCGV